MCELIETILEIDADLKKYIAAKTDILTSDSAESVKE